jgi:hypothetical protein
MYDPLALDLQRTTQSRIRRDAERITVRSGRSRRRRSRHAAEGDAASC